MWILLSIFISTINTQNCINQHQQPVDWWIIFKQPTDSKAGLIGMEYYYCDSLSDCKTITLQSDLLHDLTSPLQKTVAQIDFYDSSTMSIVWNDQPFGKPSSSTKAHSKGMLSASLNGNAFIINHSTPNFPMFDDTESTIILGMPDSSKVYGQHYMCVQVTTIEANKIAEQYIVAQIITQKSNIVPQFETLYPNIYALNSNARTVIQETGHYIATSRGGLKFHVVSSNMYYLDDFYASLVAPILKVGLVVETWGNGAGGLQDPVCDTSYITLSNLVRSYGGYQFKYTKDHSKFGISLNRNLPYVCMADINRQISQNKRGGTTFCFINANLWANIDYSFVERQTC